MFSYSYPVFERKKLLKIDMLNQLRDFPRDMFEILYQDFSDGIAEGTKMKAEDGILTIEPGILLWKGIPYILSKTLRIPYEAAQVDSYIKVRFIEKGESGEAQQLMTEISIQDTPPKEDEMELARFKLQTGARLRDEHRDFFDYNTEFDTLNRIHAPFASKGGSCIWPDISKTFAKTIMKYPLSNPWDPAFCMNCLREEGVGYEEIKGYLNVRLQSEKKAYSNPEMYRAMGRILQEIKGGRAGRNSEPAGQKTMLLM